MKKSLEQALVQAIVCLLKLHLGHSDMSTDFYIARDEYIKITVKLLECALEEEKKSRFW